MCTYGGVDYGSTDKYDQFFCDESQGTVVPITGTVSLSMSKRANSPMVQQGQSLTYTIDYTNEGSPALSHGWIWDDIDAAIGSVVTASITPSSDDSETPDSRVAWNVGNIQQSDQPGNTGNAHIHDAH